MIAAGLLAWTPVLPAAQIVSTAVTHEGRRYRVDFDVLLDAPAARLWPQLIDYEQLARLSERVVEIRVLSARHEPLRVFIALRPCVLIFCRTIRRTVDVRPIEHGHILSLADPQRGDFRYSLERWQLAPQGRRTRLRYQGEVEPRFFVPPLIGPWLIKRVVREELETTARKLEALAKP